MSPTAPSRQAANFVLTLPEGWAEQPQDAEGELLRLVSSPDGTAPAVLSFFAFGRPDGADRDAFVEEIHAAESARLVSSATDAIVIDVAVITAELGRGLRTVVAYRQGPLLLTTFIHTLPSPDGALVVSAITDGDHIVVDEPVFAAAIASLTFDISKRPELDPAELSAPESEPAPQAPVEVAVSAPSGWEAVPSTAPSVLHALVAPSTGYRPSVVVQWLARDRATTLEHAHGIQLDELAAFLTDPIPEADLRAEIDGRPAAGTAIGSLQGDHELHVRAWTIDAGAAWLHVLGTCASDDSLARADIDEAIASLVVPA